MAKPTFPGEKVISGHTGMRTYVNPSAYEPTPPKQKPELKVPRYTLKLGAGIALTLFFIWVIFLSPAFKIQNIQIRGQAHDDTIATIQTLKSKNIFLIGGRRAEETIAKKQPGIKKIQILRGIPQTIIVELVERDPAIVWESGGKQYLVDKDGILFKEAQGQYPIIVDQKNLPTKIGDQVVSPAFINYAKRLISEAPTTVSLTIDRITIPETTFQIEATTIDGPKLKFDTSRDLAEQLAGIKYVRDNHKDEAKELIDVRVQGYAYIK